jgi:hypothetical protein
MTIEPPGGLLLVYECYNMLSICIGGRDGMYGAEFCLQTRLASVDFSSFESYC